MQPWRYPYDVRGWLSEQEAAILCDLGKDKRVLEIGSFCGKSTICLAQVAKVVHSVDWHRGGDGLGVECKWTLPEFIKNLERYEVHEKVGVHCGTVELCGPALREAWFGLVFVDAAHDYHNVLHDLGVARRCVYPGGVICCHDFNETGVSEAVKDTFGNTDGSVHKDESGRHTYWRVV